MQIPIDTSSVQPPINLENDWIWLRILIQIHYTPLTNINSVQWALLQIFTDFEEQQEEKPTVSEIALMLGLEASLIEEVLNNLTTLQVLTLKSRQNPSQLSNYEFDPEKQKVYLRYGKIFQEIATQKVILFKDENGYRYQLIERQKTDNHNPQRKKPIKPIKAERSQKSQKSQTLPLNFDKILLGAIKQIWIELEQNNQELFTKGEKELYISNQEFLSNSEFNVERVEVNFLS